MYACVIPGCSVLTFRAPSQFTQEFLKSFANFVGHVIRIVESVTVWRWKLVQQVLGFVDGKDYGPAVGHFHFDLLRELIGANSSLWNVAFDASRKVLLFNKKPMCFWRQAIYFGEFGSLLSN